MASLTMPLYVIRKFFRVRILFSVLADFLGFFVHDASMAGLCACF